MSEASVAVSAGLGRLVMVALLLASQVPTETSVPKKFIGELTSNVTSGGDRGTFAGVANVGDTAVASGTCQSDPETMFAAWALPKEIEARTTEAMVASVDLIFAFTVTPFH